MKEVTHKDWMKNPIPRMMWVWDDIESGREKLKVLYILSKEEYPASCSKVIALTNEYGGVVRLYAHCAEIKNPKTRRMTNKELARWLREKPTREYKNTNNSCPIVYGEYTYLENESSDKADINILIREDDGEWRDPLVEVEE